MIVIGRIIMLMDIIQQLSLLKGDMNFKEALLKIFENDNVRYQVLDKLITDDRYINIMVKNKEELQMILDIVSKFPLINAQTIRLRACNISNQEFLEIINMYPNNELLNRIIVKVDNYDYLCLRKYKLFLEKFNAVISSIPRDSSQLEIIKYAYDFAKSKEYKNVPYDDKSLLSRNLTSAFLGEYIVCVGFTKVFNAILREFEIPCTEYNFKLKEQDGHSISIVNIDDSKYGIKGLYFFDPTKDSFIPNEQYNEARYSGFMLPLDSCRHDDLLIDSFHLMLDDDIDMLAELTKNSDGNQEYIDLFRNKQYKEELETLLDTLDIDYELFKGESPYVGLTTNANVEIAKLYQFYSKLKSELGSELQPMQFISLLINTNQSYVSAVNSMLSRFNKELTTEEIQMLAKIKKRK